MKKVNYEIKLEKSVKIILGTLAFGLILNAFLTPTGQELFGIKDANAASKKIQKITICNEDGTRCSALNKNNRLEIFNFPK